MKMLSLESKYNKERLLSITEKIFLVLSGIYLARLTMSMTMYSFPIPDPFDYLLSLLISLVVAFRVILQYKNRFIWFAVGANIIYNLTWDTDFFPMISILTVGCVGINYRKILKAYLVSVGSMIICAVLSSIIGIIPDLIYMKDGYIRSSMGIIYPTDFASFVFFLILAGWVYYESWNSLISFLFPIVSFLVALYLARSSTVILCSSVLTIVIIYLFIEKRLSNKVKFFKWIKRLADIFLVSAFPLFGLGMLFLVWNYYKGYTLGAVLNNYVTHRFVLAARAFKEYEISAFGQLIPQHGFGGNIYDPIDYFIIDCSYFRILLMYGVVIWILICSLWIFLTIRLIKNDRRKMAFAIAIVAFHALSEHHFIHICYNIFLIMPFASLDTTVSAEEKNNDPVYQRYYRIVFAIAAALGAFMIMINISRIRMISYYINDQFIMFSAYVFLEILLLVFSTFLARIIASYSCRIKVDKRIFSPVLVSAALILVLTFTGNRILSESMNRFNPVLKEDSKAMDIIISRASGKVYVDKLGELFHSKYREVTRPILDGENLARKENVSVVVDKKIDSPIFIDSGFIYAGISDRDAVYTNDDSVIRALKEAGYKVNAYCSSIYSADLEADAKQQGLILDDEGRIHLQGKKKIYHLGTGNNPFKIDEDRIINLHNGKYALNYDLKIQPTEYDMDYAVCRISLDAYGGEKGIRDLVVYRSMFDDDGYLRKPVIFKTGNYRLIQSYLIMEDGQEGVLSGVSWTRYPDYDVHYSYNNRNQIVEKRYCDRMGNPTQTAMGFASVRIAYDFQGKETDLKFYDINNDPVDTGFGFAQIKKTNNIRKQKIKEEYFDSKGHPVALEDGYFAKEWEYDAAERAVVLRLVDENGNRAETTYGFSEVHRKYDDDTNKVIEETYYDVNGNRTLTNEGYSGFKEDFEFENDEDENKSNDILISSVKTFINTDDQPVEDINGVAKIKILYNSERKIVSEEYLDKSGNIINTDSGWCVRETAYDLADNIRSYRYCNKSGEPVTTEKGYAEIIRKYDEAKRLTREYYLDEEMRPVQNNEGYASFECVYDKSGGLESQKLYDLNGSLVKEVTGPDLIEVRDDKIENLWSNPYDKF